MTAAINSTGAGKRGYPRSEERFSRNAETDLVCRLLLEKKIILDQGRVRGVAVGDRYAIFQDSRTSVHPYTGRLIRMPREVIGEVAVVSVYEQTSAGQVVRSTREVNVGAPIAPLRLALARQQAPR